jgi:hypothetical protein
MASCTSVLQEVGKGLNINQKVIGCNLKIYFWMIQKVLLWDCKKQTAFYFEKYFLKVKFLESVITKYIWIRSTWTVVRNENYFVFCIVGSQIFLVCNNFYNLDSRSWCRTIMSKCLPVHNRNKVHKALGLMMSTSIQYCNPHYCQASQFEYCPSALIISLHFECYWNSHRRHFLEYCTFALL